MLQQWTPPLQCILFVVYHNRIGGRNCFFGFSLQTVWDSDQAWIVDRFFFFLRLHVGPLSGVMLRRLFGVNI